MELEGGLAGEAGEVWMRLLGEQIPSKFTLPVVKFHVNKPKD